MYTYILIATRAAEVEFPLALSAPAAVLGNVPLHPPPGIYTLPPTRSRSLRGCGSSWEKCRTVPVMPRFL